MRMILMTPKDIEAAVREAVSGGVSLSLYCYILLALIAFVVSALGAFIGAYSKKRGENYATKQDFAELLNRLEDSTQAVEQIKAAISKGAWIEQTRWTLKKELYSTLLESLSETRHAIIRILETEMRGYPRDKHGQEQREHAIRLMMDKSDEACEKLRRAAAVSGLFLDDKTIAALDEYAKGQQSSRDADDWIEHLELELAAASRAYEQVIQVARKDLLG
jgi:hypothetical protein